ncbi:hypothetical protein N7517_009331 [Penicillium concentricum]|uniref:Uncharacterized protein n=1 Tax=Penicillium concentricum TaxID=293559 RepID=A0A9W9RH63_9EURO|nr:uncharacterized protein N7517_009331 [Penicillium concentricum]KAJ5360140.1 hypothetical protein N7517_009331 [Penicillium concentricum]
MDSPEYFISWGSERYVPLQRFKDLQSHRHDLIRYHGEVLETAQTFTQHFSKQPLQSYDMERSLKKNMGCGPSCVNEDADSTSICWLDIVRHGNFQEQSEGYYCFIQGKVFFHDQQLQNRVDFCRSYALHISNSGPSHEEVEREVEATMEILTDISNELTDVPKYTNGLKNLQRAMEIRLSNLLSLLGRGITSHAPSSSAQSSSSNGSSGSEASSDDDRDKPVAMNLDRSESGEDESGDDSTEDDDSEDDDSEDDDSEDDDSEDDDSEDDDSEDEGPGEEGPEDNGTENDNPGHFNHQQRSNDSDNGGNVAPDDGTVVSLNPLPSRTSYSMSLIAEDENAISAGHASLLEETGNAVSGNPITSNGSSSISSPTENQNDDPIDTVSSQDEPQVDAHSPIPESLTHDGRNTPIESEGPSSRAVKRRKFNKISKPQKKPPKSNRISSYEERSIAIAWTKAWIEAHSGEKWRQVTLAREYNIKFDGNRSYSTLKTWMDERENPQPKSRIVVLKFPIPYLREALSNDNSS